MEMSRLASELRSLGEKEHREIYRSHEGVSVTVTQTGKFSKHDYAVGLIQPGQNEFRPSHIRLLIDLYIKRESNREGAGALFGALEAVYDGKDPTIYASAIAKTTFPMHLDEGEVNLYLAQLLMIEQDLNFGPEGSKTSKLDPPREYLMRFIRWIAAADTEIDRVIFAAAGRMYPAPKKYSKKIPYD
jgi:hypothetical protein